MSAFDPNSNDAMFAKIMERLDDVRSDFRKERTRTDERLHDPESWKDNIKGRIAVVAIAISAVFAAAIELGRSLFLHTK